LIKRRSGTFLIGHSNRVKSKERIKGFILVRNKIRSGKQYSGLFEKEDFTMTTGMSGPYHKGANHGTGNKNIYRK
jgi:hypothetical protein